jgi:thiamine kinase-like enzyme
MTDTTMNEAIAVWNALPGCGEAKEVERLGGLTNRVYRVVTDRNVYCLRIPGEGTEEYINRRHEARASREAARVGVGAPVVHFSDETGICVTEFLDGTTMSPELFRTRKGAPARAGTALRRLHVSDAVFANRFELFAMVDDYMKLLDTRSATLPDGYREAMQAAESVRSALAANPLPLTACHCDPLCENFLDTGSRMWIVDWEYSGMNDPLWDLGDLSVEAQMSRDQEEEMLRSYFGGAPSPAERGRVIIYKAMCDFLWTLWGLIQHVNQNPADDFWAYALNRFNRCQTLMASQEFRQAIADVTRG